MSYTISQAAQMTGISPSAIRYYDKEGLLPQVERKNGIRLFSDMDIRWLHLLTCLKNTGMPIKRIREYAELAQRGDESLKERQALIRQQRQPSSPWLFTYWDHQEIFYLFLVHIHRNQFCFLNRVPMLFYSTIL